MPKRSLADLIRAAAEGAREASELKLAELLEKLAEIQTWRPDPYGEAGEHFEAVADAYDEASDLCIELSRQAAAEARAEIFAETAG